MGTIFKHNNQLIQCRDLNKKLKKLRLSVSDIEIIKDDIPNDILEQEFVNLSRGIKILEDTDTNWKYYIFQNSKGYYLWGINKPSIQHYADMGFDISDYKLIDATYHPYEKYGNWNPEIKVGRWKT